MSKTFKMVSRAVLSTNKDDVDLFCKFILEHVKKAHLYIDI